MSTMVITTNIVDLTTKLAFSGNATKSFDDDVCMGDTLTIGIAQTELDLSADGNAGYIAIRNNTADLIAMGSLSVTMRLLIGLEKGKMILMLKAYDLASLPLLADTNKFYLLAFNSQVMSLGIDFTADAGTDIITFASAHNLEVGDKLVFYTEGTMPGGLVEGTTYEVKTVESSTEITLKDGEGTLNVTDAGSGVHHSLFGTPDGKTALVSYLYHVE